MASQAPGVSAASTGAGVNENYTLLGGYDIYDRDYYKKLIKKVPRANALKWMRGLKGYMSKRTVIRDEYYFHEEGQWFNTVCTIAAVVDNTTYATITLSTADHDNSGTTSYPVVGQTVVFENEAVGYVSVVTRSVANAHTVNVYPVDTTINNIVASAVVGTTMSFYSNAQQEAGSQTEVRIPKTSKVTNYVQTFREAYAVTDIAYRQRVEWEYDGRNFMYVKGLDEMFDRFAMAEEIGLLINPASSGLVNAGSKAIRLAKGLIPQITDSGNTMEYFGTPDKSTFDDAVLILNRSYGSNEYVVGVGLNLMQGLENWLIDFARNGDNNISFNAFEGGQKQALKFNFRSVETSGYEFHFDVWKLLSHSDSLGAGSMPYRDMGIFIPLGMVANPQYGEQGAGNAEEPYLSLVYGDHGHKASWEDKGDHAVWMTGAMAPHGATSDVQELRAHVVSAKSLEARCRNKFLIMRKAA